MIKTLIITITALLISTTALANFNISDSITYKTTITDSSNGQTEVAFLRKTIISLNNTSVLIKEEQVSEQGDIIESIGEDWESLEDLISKNEAYLILENCTNAGGTYENIQSSLGDMLTCKVGDQQSTVWIGNVLFGFAKLNSQMDGFEFELEVYKQNIN